MQAYEIIKKPIGILKTSTISEVIKKLLEYNVSRLVVLDSGKPIGIISEKDVGLFLFNESTKQGLDIISLDKICLLEFHLSREICHVRDILGLGIAEMQAEALDIDKGQIDALLAERAAAKADKNFARADEIRSQLIAKGVEIMDSPEGTTWRKAH